MLNDENLIVLCRLVVSMMMIMMMVIVILVCCGIWWCVFIFVRKWGMLFFLVIVRVVWLILVSRVSRVFSDVVVVVIWMRGLSWGYFVCFSRLMSGVVDLRVLVLSMSMMVVLMMV